MEQYLLKPFKEAMMTYFDCNDDETRRTLPNLDNCRRMSNC